VKRYQFIHQQQQPPHTPVREVSHVIAELTEMLGVSKSGYYDWRDRPTSPRTQHHRELAEQVHEAYDQCHGIYGSRKITAELKDRNIKICRNTVATLMREKRLQCKAQRRKSFTVTTDSNHADPIAPNFLQRQFNADSPNEKWVADITYVPTDEGWAYLAAVMDLFSRRIVGWSVSNHIDTTLVMEALDMALETRRPGSGLMHHSDRGCQYASSQYRERLASRGIECSMSRGGDPWDNACMERFMNSYKNEWVKHRQYDTIVSVRHSSFEYIEMFYNRKRRHQALGYVSPVRYEAIHRGGGGDKHHAA